jgi:putative transposase
MHSDVDDKEKDACYFITFQTVDCVDVFVRPVYKQVVVHTLNHFIESKGLVVYAWCLMTNQLHLLAQAQQGYLIADLEKEYKAFTTIKILEALDTEQGLRKEWMLKRFESFSNILGLMKKYHIWQNNAQPLHLDLKETDFLLEHFEYIHQNPVRDKIVDIAGEYLYSSARDYAGIKGLVNIVKLPAIEQQLAASETMNGNFFVKYIRN